jgi:hypothetical protein
MKNLPSGSMLYDQIDVTKTSAITKKIDAFLKA